MLKKWFDGLKQFFHHLPGAVLVEMAASFVANWFLPGITVITAFVVFWTATGREVKPLIENEWKLECGNRIYDSTPHLMNGPVFLVPGVNTAGFTIFGLEDGPVEVSVSSVRGKLEVSARCKDNGAVIADLTKVEKTNHNLIVITCAEYSREGRILEMVFSPVGLPNGKPSIEAVIQAIDQHFFFPYQAKTSLANRKDGLTSR